MRNKAYATKAVATISVGQIFPGMHQGQMKSVADFVLYRTQNGLPCSRWDIKRPQRVLYNDSVIEWSNLVESYCRNPAGVRPDFSVGLGASIKAPWCYTAPFTVPSWKRVGPHKTGMLPDHFLNWWICFQNICNPPSNASVMSPHAILYGNANKRSWSSKRS